MSHCDGSRYRFHLLSPFKNSAFADTILRQHHIEFITDSSRDKISHLHCIYLLYRVVKTNQYDIVHCHINNSIGLFYAFVSKLAGARRVVAHTHNDAFGSGMRVVKHILRVICILLLRNVPDLYLACSDKAGKWTFGKSVSKSKQYHVIYNGIDINKFSYDYSKRTLLRRQYNLEGKYIIGHVGHFNYQKNQAYLLDVVEKVIKTVDNAFFFFIGTGETKSSFVNEVDERNLKEYVAVIDPVSNIQDYYSMFDLFVFPSIFEGFGIVMVEAQISGLRVIASDAVPRETDLTHEVVFIPVNNESTSIWADSIIAANGSTQLRVSHDKSTFEKYDINCIANTLRKCYRQLLAN